MRRTEGQPIDDAALTELLDRALPVVYDYLLHRVGDRAVADDLTSETMLGAFVTARRSGSAEPVTIGWIVGVARHKLVDHWRRQERERHRLETVAAGFDEAVDDHPIDPGLAVEVLGSLRPTYQAALTLRYVDGLSVPEVAAELGQTVGAVEVLLIRAKRAFRDRYPKGGEHHG